MGSTAENLHDRFPAITRERADEFAAASQAKLAKAYADGKIEPDLVPIGTRSAELGWGLAVRDEPPRPGTTVEQLAALATPFRPHGRVTAGNSAGLNDGATAAIIAAARDGRRPRPAAEDAAGQLRLRRRRSRRSWASARSRRPRRRCGRPA